MSHKYSAHNSLLPFFLAWQVDSKGSQYNVNFSYQLSDRAEVDCLIENLQELIKLKPHLRQTFNLENSQLIASIHDHFPAKVNFLTSTMADFVRLEQVLIHEPHDIDSQSSIRLNIIYLNDSNTYIALFNIHHIIMDGPSLDRFMVDLNHLIAGEKIDLETAQTYISKLESESPLKEENIDTAMADYIREINNITNHIDYPIGNKAVVWYYTDILPDAIMRKLTSFSHQYHVSTYNLLLLAWEIFTAKIFNQSMALVKYPVNVRTNKSIDGCFLNVVIAPMYLNSQDTYLSLVRSWQDRIITFKRAAKVMLSNKLEIGLIPSFTNASVANDVLVIKGKKYLPKNFAQIAHANINIRYREQAGKCHFTCDIYAELFPEYFSASLLNRFFNYVNKLLSDPSALISHFDLTFSEERHNILHDFNNTQIDYPQDKTLVDLFEKQVSKTPDNIAVIFGKTQLTYAQLNEQANQLANYLRNHCQIKPDDLIALILERSEYLLVCILGVLKSGGAYVPIDPAYPQERINYLLKDAKAKIIILNEIYRSKLDQNVNNFLLRREFLLENRRVIAIDNPETRLHLTTQMQTNPVKKITSNNLAYVIYTSGTTGNPKGVMIEHKSIINTLCSLRKIYESKDGAILKMTAFTSYVFDVSVAEFFSALLNGHELHILSNTLRQDANSLGQYINNHQINYLYLPPILLANLPKIEYPSLQGIIYAGEPCDPETGSYWSKHCKLYNYYGPTETSIYATGLQLKLGEVNLIGRPIANTATYVFSNDGTLLPIGLIGELYIGGAGMARGYLNLSELTAEKFITNPFQSAGHLYKTGDLVRWLPDGNLEFIGRQDFQIKIRGYRIELGEIETKLIGHSEIDRAVVMVKNHNGSNNKYLIAYYESKEELPESDLYEFLAALLPEYMVPTIFIHLDKWPLTINGKLDRNALPHPKFSRIDDYVPPSNQQEELICAAFSKVLGLEKVSANDDFFRLGGNSIKTITLVVNLQANFSINVKDIFNLKTPRKIAKNVPTVKNSLRQHLEKIKLDYKNKESNYILDQNLKDKIKNYLSSIQSLPERYEVKPLKTILLTGSTGFLGCNILNQLLMLTDYKIYLLIRNHSEKEAFDRVNEKFQFYFDKKLDHYYYDRVFIFTADLEKNNLGLSAENFQTLATQVDSIIHSAALIKHYGEYDKFYTANVQATINLLELCRLTRAKDFHYISTISVLNQGYIPHCDQYIFTEDDMPDNLEGQTNIYVKSKYQGEQEVIRYRQHGVVSNIYRIGSVPFMANNSQIQENIEENGFFNRLKCLLTLGIVPEELNLEQISAVDLTAQAIIKLFDKQQLGNRIYHVFNSNFCNIAKSLSRENTLAVKLVSMDQFIDTIIKLLNNPTYQKIIERYLLHQGWLNESHTQSTVIRILQDRTHAILQNLGFNWEPVSHEIFRKYTEMELKNVETV